MTEFEDINTQTLNKNTKEIERLNATILTLHTKMFSLENDNKDKESVVSQLKHDNYNLELKLQAGGNDSSQPSQEQQSEVVEKLMALLVASGAEVDALRMQNLQLV